MNSTKETRQERLEKWRIEKGKQSRSDKPWIPIKKRALSSRNINTSTGGIGLTETPAGSYTDFKKNLLNKTSPKSLQLKAATTTAKGNKTTSLTKLSSRYAGSFQNQNKENAEIGELKSRLKNTMDDGCVKDISVSKGLNRRHLLEEWKNERRKTISAIPYKASTYSNTSKCNQILVRQNKSSLQRQAMISQKKVDSFAKYTPPKKTAKKPSSPNKTTGSSIMNRCPKPQRRQTMVISKQLASCNTLKTDKNSIQPYAKGRRSVFLQQSKKVECSEVNATNQGIRGIKQNLKDQKPLGIKARVSVNSGFRKPHDRKNMPAIAHASQSKLVTAVDVGPQSKNIKATQLPEQATSSLLKKRRSTWSKQGLVLDLNHLIPEKDLDSTKQSDASYCSKKTRTSCHSSILKSAEKCRRPVTRKSVAFEIRNAIGSCGSPSTKRRLSSWLDSNSKKPSSYRHLHCFGVQLADLKKKGVVLNSNSLDASGMNIDSEVSDAHSFMKTTKCDHGSLGFQVEQAHQNNPHEQMSFPNDSVKLQDVLENVSILLKESGSPQEISVWLDQIYEHVQHVRSLALYWECRSQISELIGNLEEALRLVDQGIDVGAEPREALDNRRMVLLKKLRRNSSVTALTFTPKTKETDSRNSFSSTVIHYQVKDKTPIYKKLCDDIHVKPVDVLVATPVRRSSRLSSSSPKSLAIMPRKTAMCVSSLEKLPMEFHRKMILVPNPSLKLLQESPPCCDFVQNI